MKIDQIVLTNYRIYQGENILDLTGNTDKNITIVSGHNGYGKTTLLTSLVWCLYGKLMRDVDEKYKKDINESGGYKKFASKSLNRQIRNEFQNLRSQLEQEILAANLKEKKLLEIQLSKLNSYSVSITLSDIFIPSLHCDEVIINRSYDVYKNKESIEILIDGQINELTTQVGADIFIDDFVLPKEIAKFFFFDAEKIVSLAEIKTSDDKRILSKAYAEVLGIKKYEDLKSNLENLRSRLKRKSASKIDLEKFEILKKEIDESERLLLLHNETIGKIEEELVSKRIDSDEYQEKLIREGSSISLDELKMLKERMASLSEIHRGLNQEMKELMELAPFALASGSLEKLKIQLEREQEHKTKKVSASFLNKKTSVIQKNIERQYEELNIPSQAIEKIVSLIKSEFELKPEDENFQSIINYSDIQISNFYALYHNVTGSFKRRYQRLNKEAKKQLSLFNSVKYKLSNAESKENDNVIKEIRRKKTAVDNLIQEKTEELINLKAVCLALTNELASKSKIVSELEKNINALSHDKEKDKITSKLVEQLTKFIFDLKNKKKSSLEEKLKAQINMLMHKSNFINKVDVIIEGDLIDIELYDEQGNIINKDVLSMGERQLYATALLKSLVDESNIEFPIFIDSPLQKLDSRHSGNVIKYFYPKASSQVILFPLLEGELTEVEYRSLMPLVNKAYLITNESYESSKFKSVKPNKLFEKYQEMKVHV